jgi:hypothetical protein
MAETRTAKAARLLVSGAVHVQSVTRDRSAVVVIRGDHATYLVTRCRHGVIRCQCPAAAWGSTCSHRLAAVTVLEPPPEAA